MEPQTLAALLSPQQHQQMEQVRVFLEAQRLAELQQTQAAQV